MAKNEREALKELDEMFRSALDHPTWTTFNKNATSDFEFREGIQWSASEKVEIEKRGQSATVENEIKPITDRLTGQYKKMKTKPQYVGRNLGSDETRANVLTELALQACQQSEYEFEEGDMFDDGLTCGFGVMEVCIGFDELLEPTIKIRAENCLNVIPDPNSRSYNWNEDAEFIVRFKWMPLNKAKERWPAYAKELQTVVNSNPVNTTSQQMEQNYYVDPKNERVRIVEVWYKEHTYRKLAITNEGIIEVKKSKGYDNIYDRHDVKIKVGIFCSDVLLEHKDSPYKHNLFPFIPYYVYRRKNGESYGVVRMLKDPNTEINKRRSKALHLLSTNQAVYEEGAIKDKDMLAKEMAKPDGQIAHRKGYEFEILKNVDMAVSQMNLQLESKQVMARIGMPDEAMARSSEVRSGIGIQRKQMMADLIVTPIFENLRRTRVMIYKLIYELIKQYYTREKVFYITDNMQKSKEVILDNYGLQTIREGIFDIVIEEMPDTTTIQEQQFQMMSDFIKGMGLPPNVAIAALPFMIELSAFRDKPKLLEMFGQMMQAPPEKPKMNLNLNWVDLLPPEKAAFAMMMGQEQLAQFEMKGGAPPEDIRTPDKGGMA